MPTIALIPRSVAAKKPPHGSPCNNCGACCMVARCDIGTLLFGRGGACPALEPQGDGFRCGVAADPEKYMPDKTAKYGVDMMREAVLHLLYAGKGCDARFNGEPTNRAFNARVEAEYDAAKSANALSLILF